MKDTKNSIFLITFLIMALALSPNTFANIHIKPHEILNFYNGNHPPIYIDGNDEFIPENGVSGGNGTEGDPYIIEGWIIVNDGSAEIGILINNTDAFFVIRNCTINGFNDENGTIWGAGIKLTSVGNGRIENSTTYKNYNEILIDNSYDIEIENCSCSDYSIYLTTGIECRSSSNITISSCKCFDKDDGITLIDTSHVLIEKSKFYNNRANGITLYGKHIKYITIKNCKIYLNDWFGIRAAAGDPEYRHSTYFHIADCEIYDNGRPGSSIEYAAQGIYLWNYHGNIIENCTIFHNQDGLLIGSMNNVIRNCSIFNHDHGTFFLSFGVYFGGLGLLYDFKIKRANQLLNCDIYNNEIGIRLDVTKAKINMNNIFNNSYIGIIIQTLNRAHITYNNIYGNGYNFNDTMDVEVSQFSIANLKHNYWGSSDGPGGIGPGNGDSIYRKFSIAFYRPWATEPIPDAGINR